MKKIYVVLGVLSILVSYSQKRNFTDKGKINVYGETVCLTVTENPVCVDSCKKADGSSVLIGALAATVIPAVVDFMVPVIKQKVKNNALSYTGTYKAVVSRHNFYSKKSEALLPSFKIDRTILVKEGDGIVPRQATQIAVGSEISNDKTAFRFSIADDLIYSYSKAKTTGDYDYLDLQIEIKVKSMSVVKGEQKLIELRTVLIDVPIVHVGTTNKLRNTYYSGWIPLPARSQSKGEVKTKTTDQKTTSTSKDKKSAVVVEKIESEKTENGFVDIDGPSCQYELEVIVTETNPYKIRAENKKEMIDASSEAGAAVLKALTAGLIKSDDNE
ncbi:hypothetical protein [Flavobacterium sp.]|uniref:hypothetical protein n=1 Tax=Flavobacterium sp. TaxID=239 RepID=UPI001209A2ED|nr:hypothetical protein [Flavobacterium sp.]RZJ73071.1 MAG: hypothetical protein EOO49_05420 [Flavobacterium sp.]